MNDKANTEFASADGPYRLGDCEVDPETGRVQRDGLTVKLQPQAIDVLNYLINRPGQVVSRDEIEDAVWAGKTVGYDSLTGTMFKLRKALGDNTKSPKIIETIPKRGYRLLVEPEPISQFPLSDDNPVAISKSFSIAKHRSQYRILLSALLLLIAATFAVLNLIGPGPKLTAEGTERPSIVVMPFEALEGSASQAPWAEGLTDDLTTALAQNSHLLIISRDSAFVYEGQEFDPHGIGRDLRVGYALHGTVRESGKQLRINVKLVDTKDGSHIWADRFDGPSSRVFEFQDQIVGKVVDALTDQFGIGVKNEALLARTGSPKAYEAFLQGRQHFYKYLNKTENEKARELFQTALTFDPNFAMARAMLAWTHAFDAMNGWSPDRLRSLQQAEEIASEAIESQPNIPLSYFVTGLTFRERKEYVKAMVEAEKAISLDPNYANAHILLATLLYYAGRADESIDRIKKAMRLNPHHPFNYTFHLGQAYYTLRRYDEAVGAFQKGIESNPASERLHVWLAAALAKSGRMDDALWEADQVKVLNPDFSLSRMTEAFPFKDPADQEHFLSGLREAGLS